MRLRSVRRRGRSRPAARAQHVGVAAHPVRDQLALRLLDVGVVRVRVANQRPATVRSHSACRARRSSTARARDRRVAQARFESSPADRSRIRRVVLVEELRIVRRDVAAQRGLLGELDAQERVEVRTSVRQPDLLARRGVQLADADQRPGERRREERRDQQNDWRRRPESNWGWSFCRALPYHLATSPGSLSGWRESNPRVNLGKVAGYHYITPAPGTVRTVPRTAARTLARPTHGPTTRFATERPAKQA